MSLIKHVLADDSYKNNTVHLNIDTVIETSATEIKLQKICCAVYVLREVECLL